MQELNLPYHVIEALEKRCAPSLSSKSPPREPLGRRREEGQTSAYRSSDDHGVRG